MTFFWAGPAGEPMLEKLKKGQQKEEKSRTIKFEIPEQSSKKTLSFP